MGAGVSGPAGHRAFRLHRPARLPARLRPVLREKLFDGTRQDSGDPFRDARDTIAHYRQLGLDPATKAIVFFDSLDVEKVLALWREFEGVIRTSYGIGTHFTNDLGVPALNAVLKMVRCNGQPVAKISNEPGKSMCEDPACLQHLASVFRVTLPGHL